MNTLTRPVRRFALVTAMAVLAFACGCGSDPVEPSANASAPRLPDPERLVPDLGFFDQGAALSDKEAGAKTHFVNAYLRVVVVDALTRLVLAPPVTAFAVALHTVPSRQPDGSWLWVYTWVNGPEEAQIRLRGHEVGAVVQWELRVTALSNEPAYDNVLWFEGETARDGAEGSWTFHDPELAGNPAVGALTWGDDVAGEFLTLECLYGDDLGDLLTYRHDAPVCIVGFHDGGSGDDYDIRWDEVDGSGSLLVPDYNGGERACWDTRQNDTVCP